MVEYRLDDIDSLEGLVRWSLGQIAHPFDSATLARVILDGLRKVSQSARADLMLYQSDMNILFFSETSSSGTIEGGPVQISLTDTKNSAPVEALAGGHTLLVSDVRESGLLSLSAGSRTLLSIPVVYGDRLHGILNLEHPQPDAYDSETVRWVESLATVFAVLLEQSYLNEQVFRLNQRLIDQMTEKACSTDPTYRAHAQRVSELAGALAEVLRLEPAMVVAVRESGYLHDVGKTGVSQSILVKPGVLSEEEKDEVRRHPVLGRFLLKPLGFRPAVIEGVASHHERWDGTGYPRGLKGHDIPIAGRILAVAEAYDVMTSDQPYRKRLSHEDAVGELRDGAGSQFDPSVVDALVEIDRNLL
jgi:putative nucleotidyltransferase with HDIG domain